MQGLKIFLKELLKVALVPLISLHSHILPTKGRGGKYDLSFTKNCKIYANYDRIGNLISKWLF